MRQNCGLECVLSLIVGLDNLLDKWKISHCTKNTYLDVKIKAQITSNIFRSLNGKDGYKCYLKYTKQLRVFMHNCHLLQLLELQAMLNL